MYSNLTYNFLLYFITSQLTINYWLLNVASEVSFCNTLESCAMFSRLLPFGVPQRQCTWQMNHGRAAAAQNNSGCIGCGSCIGVTHGLHWRRTTEFRNIDMCFLYKKLLLGNLVLGLLELLVSPTIIDCFLSYTTILHKLKIGHYVKPIEWHIKRHVTNF